MNNNEREDLCFLFSFYVFCLAYAFRSASLLSFFFFHCVEQFYRGWQSLTGNRQSSVVYLQPGQDSVQFSNKSEMEEAKNTEAGNAIKHKPAGQSRKVDGMTEEAAEQLHYGCLAETRYMSGEGRHMHEA